MKGAIYKLFKDKTFKVTMIVGIILAILLPLLYKAIGNDSDTGLEVCTGANMLLASSSPVQNFGLAIPINLIALIVGEFTYGTIRNKVIVGYKKSTIYFQMFVSSLIFTFILIFIYIGVTVAFASILGKPGFDIITGETIWKLLLCILTSYIFVTSLSVFCGTLIRKQGFAMGLTILILMICFIAAMITATLESVINIDKVKTVCWLDPIFLVSCTPLGGAGIGNVNAMFSDTNTFVASIVSPLLYGAIFYLIGSALFSYRDLK